MEIDNITSPLPAMIQLHTFFSNNIDVSSKQQVTNFVMYQILNLEAYINSSEYKDVFSKSRSQKRKVKPPKGCIDVQPNFARIREKVIDQIRSTFKLYGAETIITPVFENRKILLGQYGEGEKLIFNLEDQGGELLSLRYDLTVPLCRYIATHNVKQIKRYQIAPVYRRDEPNQKKGRLREFLQCDYDVVGNFDRNVTNVEVLSIIYFMLSNLQFLWTKEPIGFNIRLNSREILESVVQWAEIPSYKFKTVCSAIDKLDSSPWEKVRDELISKVLKNHNYFRVFQINLVIKYQQLLNSKEVLKKLQIF